MQDAEVDRRTAIDEYQWFREICSSALVRAPQIVLGGPGVVVHIDESLFRHKPKVLNIHIFFLKHFCTTTEVVQPLRKCGCLDLSILLKHHPWAIWR